MQLVYFFPKELKSASEDTNPMSGRQVQGLNSMGNPISPSPQMPYEIDSDLPENINVSSSPTMPFRRKQVTGHALRPRSPVTQNNPHQDRNVQGLILFYKATHIY